MPRRRLERRSGPPLGRLPWFCGQSVGRLVFLIRFGRGVPCAAPNQLGDHQGENPRMIGGSDIVDADFSSIVGAANSDMDRSSSAAIDADRNGGGGSAARKDRALSQLELELDRRKKCGHTERGARTSRE